MEFFQDENGLHKFGGEIPSGFNIPHNEFLAGFQYLGKIAKADKNFNWLPFDLNLICPIFTDFDYMLGCVWRLPTCKGLSDYKR